MSAAVVAGGAGIAVPVWVGWVVAGLGALVIAFFVVRALLRDRAAAEAWRTLEGAPFPASYQVSPGVQFSEDRLRYCLGCAYQALAMRGPWPTAVLWANLTNVNVWIVPEGSLRASAAGMTVIAARTVLVEPSLAALAHELAHLIEGTVDGVTDNEHLRWTERGLWSVDATYHSTLVNAPTLPDVPIVPAPS